MNKITLDKAKRYNISELNEEQIEQIAEATGDCSTDFLNRNKQIELYFDNYGQEWLLDARRFHLELGKSKGLINAKTLFEN